MKSPVAKSTSASATERVAENRLPWAREKPPHRRRLSDQFLSPAILSPALTLIVIFVYVFIAITIWVSLSNWHTLKIDMTLRQPIWATYQQMFVMPRWHAD